MPLRGLLLDLDGTLLDSNPLHVEAFRLAFLDHYLPLSPDLIAPHIGKGGDQLVPDLLGPDDEARLGESVRAAYLRHFTRLCRPGVVPLLPGTVELLRALKARGVRTTLATSAKAEQLDLLFRSAGTDLRKEVDALTTSDDAEKSKPHPDIFTVAAKGLGLHPAQCAVLGDTIYDARAARHAGATSLALATWSPHTAAAGRIGQPPGPDRPTDSSESDPRAHDRQALRTAGARRVYRDPADLLAHLDDALRAACPLDIDLDEPTLHRLLQPALDAARANLADGGAPIGAALYDARGNLLATGANQSHRTRNGVDHAEIVTLHRAAGRDVTSGVLATTLEPCVMCTGAAMESTLDTLLFALPAPADNGSTRVAPPTSPDAASPRTLAGPRAAEARQLFEQFLATGPDEKQSAFVRQLLSLTKP